MPVSARDRLRGFVVEAEVQDRVHHARHRGAGAGAHRDEQRVFRIAELAADGGADFGERGFDLRLQVGGIGAVVCVVVGADFGRDREARRHGQTEVRHLGEVRTLAAQSSFILAAPSALPPPKL